MGADADLPTLVRRKPAYLLDVVCFSPGETITLKVHAVYAFHLAQHEFSSTLFNDLNTWMQSVDESIRHALEVMHSLMPHVNVQQQISTEQQVWLTFSSLVEGNRSNLSR
jgi:hypothetical protein